MFDNIIEQGAAVQLGSDILSRRLAPSMLFFGPPASGKGSAALELARVLSCENGGPQPDIAPWNCSCPACVRHRYLLHGDLAIIGPRLFAGEIAASRVAFLREPAASSRILFIRSLRKLLARFSPAVWEYESRSGKTNPLLLLQSLEEYLSEFESLALDAAADGQAAAMSALEKLSDSMVKNALKLEDEAIGDNIPIAQIRRAAYWSRLAPHGRRKTIIIENADHMKDEAKNSLLKLLEEPPETLSIVLCVQRREAILPTILSRLRPYRFLKRSEEHEREIIRRIYRDSASSVTLENGRAGLISAYLDSFLPRSTEKLYPLAAFFAASLARDAAVSLKKRGAAEIPAELAALGSRCGPIAEAAGFARVKNVKDVIGTLLAESGNFEARSFSRFIRLVLDFVSQALRGAEAYPCSIAYNDIWRKYAARAETATGVFNQNPALALESFFFRVKEDITGVMT